MTDTRAFLRAPPFPGVRVTPVLARNRTKSDLPAQEDAALLATALAQAQVGGDFWAARPDIPFTRHIILCPRDTAQAKAMIDASAHLSPRILWVQVALDLDSDIPQYTGRLDPWHMTSNATAIWVEPQDERRLIAALAGVTTCQPDGSAMPGDPADLLRDNVIAPQVAVDPFTGKDTSFAQIVALLAHWRGMIDANRPIAAAFGFGQWKQDTVAPLLWNGSDAPVLFAAPQTDQLNRISPEAGIALWKARVPPAFLEQASAHPGPKFEVEDGFIRSAGLGADCVPPLSIVVDPLGAHFDPSGPTGLENLLAQAEFTPEILERARQLRALIVESGLSKYEAGTARLERPGGTRRHVLVTGQVEDDRSVLFGGGEVRTNLEVLRRARILEPDAYLLFKPHPDVLSGHRTGHIPDADVMQYADAIVSRHAIGALLDMVDGVHVITSLAGFEALLRGKQVTTHGVPFYAGWGLTTDLGAVPARRGRARSMDDLVAATLLLYPRYLDPVTNLPCPPEIMVARLLSGVKRENKTVVTFRRILGGIRRMSFHAGLRR